MYMAVTDSKKVQKYSGIVVKKSGDKTLSVEVVRYIKHKRYDKFVKIRKKFLVHDESGKFDVGDKVEFVSCRPVSKRKHFIIVNE